MKDGYEELANAIVLQAVKDWRKKIKQPNLLELD